LFKGGLSPDIGTIDQMRTIERDQEIPHRGGFCDLMWSDPDDIDWWAISPRGAGWLFGEKPTNQFMLNNQLTLICRAHQLVQEGEICRWIIFLMLRQQMILVKTSCTNN